MEVLSLGGRLAAERARIGITQGDCALLAGVSRNMWGHYERDVSKPGAEVFVRLVGHGFDINYLLGGTRTLTETTLSDEEQELLHYYRSTDDDGRRAVLRQAQMEATRATGGGYVAREPPPPHVLHDAPAPKRPPKPPR